MTTYQSFKNSFLFASLSIVFSFVLMSCGGNQNVDSAALSNNINEVKSPPTIENDSRFMDRAAQYHFEQILLSKLARQRATTEEVRELAIMLEEDHRAAKSALGSKGIIKSIPVPSVPDQDAHDAYDKLNEVAVEDFDAAYLSRVIQGHQDIIRLYEQCATAQYDPVIQSLAANHLPELRIHLTKAMNLDTQSGPLSEVIH